MIRRPPRSTRTDTLFPYTTLFRSAHAAGIGIDASMNSATPDIIRLDGVRSEEHTSELQSLMRISYAVYCLKKQKHPYTLSETCHSSSEDHVMFTVFSDSCRPNPPIDLHQLSQPISSTYDHID